MAKIFPTLAAALSIVLLLDGCGPAPAPQGINDPDEAANREVHELNKAIDRTLVDPASKAYGKTVPTPLQRGVQNFADNLDAPGDVVNGLLQGRPGPALGNTARFLINSTIGLAGLFDPAKAMGLPGKKTDFGETLHVWGFGEGSYVELPLLGPSTSRDTVGRVVDVALNPLRLALPAREANIATGASIASRLGDRYRFGTTVDSILYESADSYAQARLLYLQNRRFELGQGSGTTTDEGEFLDPYEEK